jgi:RNAse (barnase) inhibitor barstar
MTAPEVVVLDTRGAADEQAFLSACARALGFPDSFGHNWVALADSLGDFVARQRPVLVVWTGASDLPTTDLHTAMQIMAERFTDGADLLVVDSIQAAPTPDAALDHVHLPIPADGRDAARRFWNAVGLQESPDTCGPEDLCMAADALVVHLSTGSDTGTVPAIALSDVEALVQRLSAAGYPVHRDDRRLRTLDPFGNPIEFIGFPQPEEEQ